jgi:hypothetical protein
VITLCSFVAELVAINEIISSVGGRLHQNSIYTSLCLSSSKFQQTFLFNALFENMVGGDSFILSYAFLDIYVVGG